MFRLLLKILLILLLIAVLLVGGVWAYVKIKGEKALLENAVANFTDYTLVLPEDTKLSLLPQPKLTASAVALRDKTASEADMFTAEDVLVDLHLTPTWNKAKLVRIDKITLSAPKVTLPTIQASADALEVRKAHVGHLLADAEALFVPVEYARVDKGMVALQHADGTTQNITNISLLARGESAQAVTATLKAVVDKLPVSAQGQFDVRNIGNIPSSITAQTAGLTVKATGDVRGQNRFVGSAVVTADNLATSLKKLPLEIDLGNINLAQSLRLETTLDAQAERVNVKTLNGALGESVVLDGNLLYTPTSLEGAVNIARLNLNALNLCGTTQGVGEVAQQTATQATDESPWGNDPLPAIGVPLPSVDLALNIQNLACNDAPITAAKASLQQRDGAMSLDDIALTVGEGMVTGNLFANAADENITLNMALKNLEVMDFVAANTAFLKKLSVPLNGDIVLKTHGTTMASAIQSLDGTLRLNASAGNFPGTQAASLALDVANLLQGAGSTVTGKTLGTEIENFTLNASIAQGVVTCELCRLKAGGGRIMLNGEGTIDLPKYTYNLKVTPEAKLTSAFKLPLKIMGALNQPKVTPVLATTQNVATGIGTALGGPAGAAVGAMLGGVLEKQFGKKPAPVTNSSGTVISITEPQQGYVDAKVDEEVNRAQQKVNEEIQRGVTRGLNKLFGN